MDAFSRKILHELREDLEWATTSVLESADKDGEIGKDALLQGAWLIRSAILHLNELQRHFDRDQQATVTP